MIFTGTSGKYKNFVCTEQYFQKKNSKIEIFESLIFQSKFPFFGDPLPLPRPTTTTNIKKLSKVLIVDEKLSSITTDGEGLLKMFWLLKINKGHGGGNGYISMLKICDSSIVKPLSLIFENFLRIAISQKLSNRKT